ITLVDETQGRYGDDIMFDVSVLDGDEVLAEPEVTVKDVNLSVDEVTLAQALAALKSEKVQEEANIVSWDNKLFDKAMKRVNTFVDMDTELVEGSEVRAEGKEDKETTKLQRLIEVVPDKEEVAIDVIPLATKPPSILVKAKYGSTRPMKDLDLVLYGDLKTMFDPHVEDQVWKNQSDYKVLKWKLYDSCGVHSLRKQNVHINMLVEKRYPLTAPTITDMLNKKLKADH
ncbi:hypothetical protein Tco_0845213, partial [Tanacetum coccineum]